MNLNVNKYFVVVAAVGFLRYVVMLGAGYLEVRKGVNSRVEVLGEDTFS